MRLSTEHWAHRVNQVIRVVVVATDPARREELCELLAAVPGLRVTAAGAELPRRRGHRGEVLLVQHDFGSDDTRLIELGRLSRRRRVVVTSMSQLRSDIWMAVSCGALGYATSDAELVPALRSAAEGRPHRPYFLGDPPAWLDLPHLTDRVFAYVRERERAQYHRLIHDHVLQTLEGLALSPSITDVEVKALLSREAGALRRFIRAGVGEDVRPLLTELRSIIARHDRKPLDVVLRTDGHTTPPLADQTLRALADAANEALCNVSKHAAAPSAAVTVTAAPDAVSIRIVDSGVGFNRRTTRPGFGLNESIVARMQSVGGNATIESIPGRGTVVELTGPAIRVPSRPEHRAA
ncbi:sensor histidine kinase [Actinoplanes awajinensis]|uniref:Histidine kinase/HSP90-like ATPase domain-containing protein n=1 Tax=Actinoplanes awajinensis subsp. mycoplanecinus TaxID=135947 RepID=A0A0X3UUH8_9ACTN|nr:ATP-binding protein [Actinoplanes awajinensis]KUL34526.1 hypothetical protein ADL15_15740 [Actinoplanes awajinensis subsp. mycoplanecinus]